MVLAKTSLGMIALLATGVTLGAFAGCGSSTVSCGDVCSCLGKSGDKTCVASCTQAEADAKKQATDSHCLSQYTDLTTCESDNSTCDSVKKVYTYPAGVCDTELRTYDSCAHIVTTGTGSSSASSTGSGG